MKKTFVLFCAIVALAACAKIAPETEADQKGNQEIKINLTINRTDISNDTKAASVKTGWAEGDVIFLFFSKATAPEHMKLTYSSSGTWTPSYLEGFDPATVFPKGGTMTAIYLPYGSTYTVGTFSYMGVNGYKIVDPDSQSYYSGHYYASDPTSFEYVGSTLTGSISLAVPSPSNAGDRLVHFNIKGSAYEVGHTYVMTQDYLKARMLTCITPEGQLYDNLDPNIGQMTVGIPGYYDADPNNDGAETDAIISFSGILDASVVDTPTDYRFLIHDKGVKAYFGIAKGKTISDNSYIDIGDISTSWKQFTNYFSISPTKIATFASGNLVATITAVDGEGVPTTATWDFHDEQYGMVFKTTAGGTNTFGVGDKVDSFCWVGNSSTVLTGPVTKYGVSSSTTDDDYGTNPDDNLKADWGNTIGGGWRTPTAEEWMYVIGSHPDQDKYCRLSTYRYTRARINIDPESEETNDNHIRGLIIFPDNYEHPASVPPIVTLNVVNNPSINWDLGSTGNVFTKEQWALMESAGAIFLPVAGTRNGYSVGSVNVQARYWTSSHATSSARKAQRLYWDRTSIDENEEGTWNYRARGHSVRLIKDLNQPHPS